VWLHQVSGETLPADLVAAAQRFDPDDEFVLSDLREAPAPADLPELVEQLIEGAYDAGRASESLLGAAARLGWPELTADALTPHLVTLIRLAVDVPGRLPEDGLCHIADPYAGSGD